MNIAVDATTRGELLASRDRSSVIAEEMLLPMGADGIYARTGPYEHLVERLGALISRYRDHTVEVLRFPPVMSRAHLEKSGYLKSFPNLLGCVCALSGSEAEIRSAADRHETGGDWTVALQPADLVLSPAACYPVYPLAAERGPIPRQGLRFDVACDCFRREPSRRLDRLQSFRMREYVLIGTPSQVTEFRDKWITRASRLAERLKLPHLVAPANDPFFGRAGQVKAISQLQQELKFELLLPINSEEPGTACMSFNYHRDHFGTTWDLRGVDGAPAHTACVAFGMDRLAVALFVGHGTDFRDWPQSVRTLLGV